MLNRIYNVHSIHLGIVPPPEINTWALVFGIFGGTLALCIVFLATYWLYQKRKRMPPPRYPTEDSVCDPILNATTLNEIMEMTTSGSGSGGFLIS